VTATAAIPAASTAAGRRRESAHQPDTTTWDCKVCPVPWPCPARRVELSHAYGDAPESLRLYLTDFFVRAAGGRLGHRPARFVWDQFFGWLGHRRVTTRPRRRRDPG
jgi:hypothetical protein